MILGLDIGGAHLKAAWVRRDGRLIAAAQVPTPLWQGLGHLREGLSTILGGRTTPQRVAVTMTGELVDLFEDRAAGVAGILEVLGPTLRGADVAVYRGVAGFLDIAETRGMEAQIASANWLATAHVVTRRADQGILVDIGSTTTDIVPFAAGMPRHAGTSDAERLERGELVYTGVVRTPVMAVTPKVPLRGLWRGVMAEYFATMADVHRLTGELPADADQHPTADGRDRSRLSSARRLARMIGADEAEGSATDWARLARYLADCQLRAIEDGLAQVTSRGDAAEDAPVVGAGVGRFLARRLADRARRPYLDYADLLAITPDLHEEAGRCAPAVAVAMLAAESAHGAPGT
ncbi:hydantoinase/oxoprolinase family protein [Arenibaculum pallidiluteum]|uniref:hydantoinase/oxoprolinase family protein n=1 Tax=Arenibaculum pallidiluteum TaxID=2812559 RepID=UPI001A963705|nr:hydantoinase/oxoprolinase family protein [Arenibaculum pallidiluteum]